MEDRLRGDWVAEPSPWTSSTRTATAEEVHARNLLHANTVKLRLAIKNRNDLVGLGTADRARIVHALPDTPPSGLAELRGVLVRQLKQVRDRETQVARSRERSTCATRENARSRKRCYRGQRVERVRAARCAPSLRVRE